MRRAIRFLRRGGIVEIDEAPPAVTLLDWLRLREGSCGTKEGCAEGDCGACTVVLRRLREGRLVAEPVNSCITLLGQIDGTELVTVEDLAEGAALHPVQAAMVALHGSQCGFCTPGIVMSLFALYQDAPRPLTRRAITDALAGNLCRCTGYRPIVDAAFAACAEPAADRFAAGREAVATRLAALADGQDLFVGTAERFFAAPASEEALAALCLDHPDATLVAGSTDVGLWVTKALTDLRKVIHLGRVAGLDRVVEEEGALTFGATVPLARALPHLAAVDPDLGELMRRFGSPQVRVTGTVGGNIANGSPIGDLAPAFIALGGTLALRRGGEARRLALEDFFLDYRKQDRQPGEYLRSVTIPTLAPGDVFRAFKVTKRFDEDISAVMGAFRFRLEAGRVASARLAYGGMAGIPKRALRAEAALAGVPLADETAWEPALAALEADFAPLSDHRASAGYRRTVARNLLRKALMEAAGRATRETRLVGHREMSDAAE
ncbi:xanthine dehydrogenase small subunit [Chelatococcus sp. SYSU_G07232]|uniref:Xanthine dehydrogenase small subunit n=1 Tax=Chelatococcus albus TaxID=3047466 RepID=A0ABT7AHW4_9HYPH|nr:xanthine dehydrogenase small subunit [Chelatococcus sp. SYSU_G07232]MDJ1158991.1 xanthine dehydrogenase small subunit [Chelatococcus sp. SYSU_G07232]